MQSTQGELHQPYSKGRRRCSALQVVLCHPPVCRVMLAGHQLDSVRVCCVDTLCRRQCWR